VTDQRARRGIRYRLPAVLMIGLLAKLAGQNRSRAMAHWAKLRQHALSQFFQLKRQTMPHDRTWSRLLASAAKPEEVEEVLATFFAHAQPAQESQRGSVQGCLDGKTLRGTIPAGHTRGIHLLAAYLPEQGVVLMQVQVDKKTNEIGAAPHLVQALDLRGVVVRGDAMQAQVALSIQIVESGGDSLWTAKDNQPELRQEIALLFEPQQSRPGWSAAPMDLRSASTIEKGHGRLEKRTITVSRLLEGYSAFPKLAQVFTLERWASLTGGRSRHEVHDGVSSLPASVASPERLLALVRRHWGSEHGLHSRRDVTLDEDHSQLRMGQAPHLLAILNNVVIGLAARQRRSNLAETRREFAYQFDQALAALVA
jgi:predicted transposase YbfD/YdcC